jgi:hypothetical protein
MSETIINNRINQISDPGYRQYFDSEESFVIAQSLGNVHDFTERQVEILENAIDLFLLCLLTDETLGSFIERQCGLSGDVAGVLASAIELALPPDINTARQYPEKLFGALSRSDISHEIAETEAALAQTIPVRTMARDMHDLESQAPAEAPVYRSEQPSVRNRPLTDIPRWDSERT